MLLVRQLISLFQRLLTREIISYLIVGVLTTLVSLGSFALLLHLGIGLVLSNTLSTFLAILFAYVTNKIWVFRALNYEIVAMVVEFLKFLSSRVLTYVIDTILLVFLVDFLLFDPLAAKIFTSVVVVILNYFLSKKAVFRQKD